MDDDTCSETTDGGEYITNDAKPRLEDLLPPDANGLAFIASNTPFEVSGIPSSTLPVKENERSLTSCEVSAKHHFALLRSFRVGRVSRSCREEP